MTLGGPELQLRVSRRPDLQQRIVAAVVELEARDRLGVASIQVLGQTEHRGERSDRLAPLPSKIPVSEDRKSVV